MVGVSDQGFVLHHQTNSSPTRGVPWVCYRASPTSKGSLRSASAAPITSSLIDDPRCRRHAAPSQECLSLHIAAILPALATLCPPQCKIHIYANPSRQTCLALPWVRRAGCWTFAWPHLPRPTHLSAKQGPVFALHLNALHYLVPQALLAY